MATIKSKRVPLPLDRKLYEQVREEAKRQRRTVKEVGTALVTAGLESLKREPQPTT